MSINHYAPSPHSAFLCSVPFTSLLSHSTLIRVSLMQQAEAEVAPLAWLDVCPSPTEPEAVMATVDARELKSYYCSTWCSWMWRRWTRRCRTWAAGHDDTGCGDAVCGGGPGEHVLAVRVSHAVANVDRRMLVVRVHHAITAAAAWRSPSFTSALPNARGV